MNSDPHESAAWRAFGLLDADEAAGFDEAMRLDPELKKAFLEMETLTAAVAAASVQPVTPRAGQLERLERLLGVQKAKRTNWAAISGWAAAAAVTLFLFIEPNVGRTKNVVVVPPPSPATAPAVVSQAPESAGPSVVDESPASREMVEIPQLIMAGQAVEPQDESTKVIARQETRKLIQEIEVLQEKLQDLQARDRERFEAVPGTAWPIVMRMSPPGMPPEPSAISFGHDEPPMTAILGDALASANDPYDEGVSKSGLVSKEPTPSAVPIYDAARDTGTLVVNNLPATISGETYNLWVKPEGQAKPVHVGRLPESNARAADSFDFSLGSVGIIPAGFILTRDSVGKPPQPTAGTTVLQGP